MQFHTYTKHTKQGIKPDPGKRASLQSKQHTYPAKNTLTAPHPAELHPSPKIKQRTTYPEKKNAAKAPPWRALAMENESCILYMGRKHVRYDF